jgi:Zn-dependent M28 family amino/carboxypeptidase
VRPQRRTTVALTAIGVGAAGLVYVSPAEAVDDKGCGARTTVTVRQLLQCVTVERVMEHEHALQSFADEHDGTRASGTPGFNDSMDYVEDKLLAAGYEVSRQPFSFHFFEDQGGSILQKVSPGPVSYVEGTDFIATPQSEFGEAAGVVRPVDVLLGPGNTSTSGCEATDFAGFPVGAIALIQRGTCTFEIKGNNAAAAGASGVLFFNQGNNPDDPSRMGIPAVTLGDGYSGGIPALSTTYALGVEFSNTPGLIMRLKANVTRELRQTSNLLAESRGGDPDNVVMAGAHLDSVENGPGINDNGSGSSALLEVAEQMAKARLENKVRFAWWGAEEAGLVGSTRYVNALTEDQLGDLEMYLNFDMVASPNYGLFIYDGDGSGFGLVGPPGSDDIEALFEKYYAERKIPSEPTAFTGRSDYQAFINHGVPAGGLFTGAEVPKTAAQVAKWGGQAGVAYDSCYHSACDTIDNLNQRALDINADAIAYAVYLYASGGAAINLN